ncbi:MAG: extracellular solute-binding protein [Bacillota bacterium]
MFKHLRKNRKTIITLLLLSSLTLTSCGGSGASSTSESAEADSSASTNTNSTSSSEKITLTFWHYYNSNTKDMLDTIIAEFNATVGAEKNITIDAYSHSSVGDLSSALVSAANKEIGMDDMPDIFSAYSDTALLLDDIGVVAEMDPYFTEEELSLFQADFLEEGRFDDEENLKILPVAKSTELLFINQSDFQVFLDATGTNTSQLQTWEGLAEVAEVYYDWTDSLTPEEGDGRALFGLDSEANFMLVAAKQVGEEMYVYTDHGVEFGLSEDAARKIWDNYIVPYTKGHYVAYGSFRSDDIRSGDLLMYTGSTSSINYFPEFVELNRTDSYDIEGGTLPLPYFEGGEKVAVQQGAGMLISKTDPAREAAAIEFLKWFTSPECTLDFAVSTGYIPVQNEAMTYDKVMAVTEEFVGGEVSNIVQSAADVTYNIMLPEYEFYANRPFVGSYDARNALSDSFITILDELAEIVATQVESGVDREEAIATALSDENFEKWYESLKDSVTSILVENQS